MHLSEFTWATYNHSVQCFLEIVPGLCLKKGPTLPDKALILWCKEDCLITWKESQGLSAEGCWFCHHLMHCSFSSDSVKRGFEWQCLITAFIILSSISQSQQLSDVWTSILRFPQAIWRTHTIFIILCKDQVFIQDAFCDRGILVDVKSTHPKVAEIEKHHFVCRTILLLHSGSMAIYGLHLGAASHKDNIVPTTSTAISLHYWSDWGSFVIEFSLT